jgi:hypothetical protein
MVKRILLLLAGLITMLIIGLTWPGAAGAVTAWAGPT